MKRFRLKYLKQFYEQRSIKNCCLAILLLIYGSAECFSQTNGCSFKPGTVKFHALVTPSVSSAFKASLNEKGNVVLNWTTSAGTDNSHFIMQRSIDGSEFNDAALLFATEGSQNTSIKYSYTDNLNLVRAKRIFYRIKMVNAQGKITYTSPLQVSLEKTNGQKGNKAYFPSI